MMTKAQVITSRRIIKVEYVGFDHDGYSIYKEIGTGREYHEIELDFDYASNSNIVVNILNFFF